MGKHKIGILALLFLITGCTQQTVQMITEEESNKSNLTLHEAAREGAIAQIQSLIARGGNIDSRDAGGSTPLHYAAAEGHTDIAELLLTNGADVNAKDTFGDTPLHVASFYDSREGVELLLSHGAQPGAKNDMGKTPLHQASSLTVARFLISAGADINAKDLGSRTALYGVVQSGDVDMAEFLISNGADVNVAPEGDFGSTPLHNVAMSTCKPLVQLLIDKGADLSRKSDSGETPADVAMSFENPEIAKLLVDPGADATIHLAAYLGDLKKIGDLLQTGVDVNARDEIDRTPLHIAAESGQKEVANLLITRGADVDTRDIRGMTPLLEAYRNGETDIAELLVQNGATVTIEVAVRNGDLEILNSLVEAGADVNATHPLGGTLLHEAARQGHTDIAKLLIADGAEVETEYIGMTPLHEASAFGHEHVAELLLASGGDINARNSHNLTSLYFAASAGHKDVVEMLIAEGADVNAGYSDNFTPLHAAALAGHKDVVEMLITEGADVNARASINNETPLLMACLSCFEDVAELLIDKGADVNVRDTTGRTALSWPAYYGHTELVRLLIANGTHVRCEFSLDAALSAGFDDIVAMLGADPEGLANADRGPYSVIVTDPQSTRLFLEFAEIGFDGVWVPGEADIEGMDSVLIGYLKENASIESDTDLRYILLNLRRYNGEYSGFIKGGKKYIICNMILFDESFPLKPLGNQFRRFFDIGYNVVKIVFDVKGEAIERIDIN